MTLRPFARFASFLAAFAAGVALAGPLPIVSGYPAPEAKSTAAPAQLRLNAKSTTPLLQLGPMAERELEPMRADARKPQGKRVMIGVNRDVLMPLTGSSWTAVDGGYAMRLSASSPEALGLRLAVDLKGLSPNVEMVVFGSGESRLFGPIRVGSIRDATQTWWSPLSEGDTQTIEFFVPGDTVAGGQSARISGVSHIFFSPASGFTKRASEIGRSGSCNIDIQCVSNPSTAFLNTRNSVAKMVYNVGASTFLCTGQILADAAASGTPWFYGANHCFESENPPFRNSTQMQQIADTLQTYWFFEAITCGSTAVPNFTTLPSGALYLFNNPNSDVLFLRLNNSAPPGSFFTGWDANPITAQEVIALHHPLGDLKKFSRGTALNFINQTPGSVPTSFIEVQWNLGTTEGGSSGSGIWTFSNGQYFLRGGLLGGDALCTNPLGTDKYSRFDQAFPFIRIFLQPSAATTNYTSLWKNANEEGWGININHQGNILFATLFNYAADLQPLWLVASNLALQQNGAFSGSIFQLTGDPFFQLPWNENNRTLATVGTMTISFSGPGNGTLTYTYNGTTVTKSIVKQEFGPIPTCVSGTGSRINSTNYQDLWFNPDEEGWGINFTHQGNIIFATLFNYNNARRDVWLVANNLAFQGNNSYQGDLLVTAGGPFNASPWPAFAVQTVGSMNVQFINGENAVLTYTAGGNLVTKNIRRQVFGNTVPICN